MYPSTALNDDISACGTYNQKDKDKELVFTLGMLTPGVNLIYLSPIRCEEDPLIAFVLVITGFQP
jgi:hypothetical protein